MHPLFAIVLTATLSLVMCDPTGVLVGGISSEEKPASPVVIKLVEDNKDAINAKMYESCVASLGSNSGCSKSLDLKPMTYKSQVVSGTNYFIKVRARDEKENQENFWHVRIYNQPWTNTTEVTSVKGPEEESSPITYF